MTATKAYAWLWRLEPLWSSQFAGPPLDDAPVGALRGHALAIRVMKD